MLFVFLVFSMRHTQCTQHLPLKCCFCCCCKFKWIQISNAWILQHTAHSTHDSFSENDKFWHLCFGCHFLKYWHFLRIFRHFINFLLIFSISPKTASRKTPHQNLIDLLPLTFIKCVSNLICRWHDALWIMEPVIFPSSLFRFFLWCVSILCECACVYPNDK